VKTTDPAPLIDVDRASGAARGRADMDVAEIGVPALVALLPRQLETYSTRVPNRLRSSFEGAAGVGARPVFITVS
jgi:hypothetical protein